MKYAAFVLFTFVVVGFILVSCHNSGSSETTTGFEAATPSIKSALEKQKTMTLLFFINPKGSPCKKQKEILTEWVEANSNQVELVVLAVSNRNDLPAFHTYGIRALPAMVMLNRKGGEITRIVGVHPKEVFEKVLNEARTQQ
jgi:thioredoxin-related protein